LNPLNARKAKTFVDLNVAKFPDFYIRWFWHFLVALIKQVGKDPGECPGMIRYSRKEGMILSTLNSQPLQVSQRTK